jgi:Fe-S-cluster containining protein
VKEYSISSAQLLRKVRTATFDLANEGRALVAKTEGRPVSCTPGCAYCCYQKIVLDIAQGLAIYLHLRERWTPALERRLLAADRDMTRSTHAAWLGQRRPCVFLKEEAFGRGTCTIYSVRPTACANTFAVGEPAGCAVVGGTNLIGALTPSALALGRLHIEIAIGQRDDDARTLPGAVLAARSLVEGTPEPAVHKVRMSTGKLDLEDRFDEVAEP